jgi:hypothetical protein
MEGADVPGKAGRGVGAHVKLEKGRHKYMFVVDGN